MKRNKIEFLNTGRQHGLQAKLAGPPHVFYLAGIPRTGSTVLGQALGDMPGVIFVGELNLFWRRFANDELCTCGQPLPRCQFWSAVISKGFGELRSEDAQNLAELEQVFRLREGIVRPLLSARRKFTEFERSHDVVNARLQLYRSIANTAHVEWIIDSGKDPWYGGFLGRLFGDSFGTVHVVRDPRGVAFSRAKLVRSDSEPTYMPRRHPARTALSWLVQNLEIQFFLKRLSASYVRLRYEDFAADSKAIVRNVACIMGVEPDQLSVRGSHTERRDDLHWVAGNPSVRKFARSSLHIKLDEEWRDRLPSVQRWLVTLICGVLLPFYGYSLRNIKGYRHKRLLGRDEQSSQQPA
jgi:hypothetical protein